MDWTFVTTLFDTLKDFLVTAKGFIVGLSPENATIVLLIAAGLLAFYTSNYVRKQGQKFGVDFAVYALVLIGLL